VNYRAQFQEMLSVTGPILALAPMQDVTDLAFLKLIAAYGGADLYFTEYFRVHATSTLDKHILRSITANPTGRPIIAQMIGNDIPSLVRTVRELERYPVAAVDLNLGCPAPVVYRKCAGGGLLREPLRVDSILGALRDAVKTRFTVKTRIGFDSPEVFSELLPIFARHSLDLLTVHGRTVKEMYKPDVHYEYIARAVAEVPCPVLANGNVDSAQNAAEILRLTGARGLMIGRGAIRNPWLFHQIRQLQRGETLFVPRGLDVLAYVRALYEAVCSPDVSENSHVQKMKKYMNYIGLGVESTGQFLHQIRRVATRADFFRVCEEFLNHDRPMPLEPFSPAVEERASMSDGNPVKLFSSSS
jgi:tRNA-dihydrouridine synthase B